MASNLDTNPIPSIINLVITLLGAGTIIANILLRLWFEDPRKRKKLSILVKQSIRTQVDYLSRVRLVLSMTKPNINNIEFYLSRLRENDLLNTPNEGIEILDEYIIKIFVDYGDRLRNITDYIYQYVNEVKSGSNVYAERFILESWSVIIYGLYCNYLLSVKYLQNDSSIRQFPSDFDKMINSLSEEIKIAIIPDPIINTFLGIVYEISTNYRQLNRNHEYHTQTLYIERISISNNLLDSTSIIFHNEKIYPSTYTSLVAFGSSSDEARKKINLYLEQIQVGDIRNLTYISNEQIQSYMKNIQSTAIFLYG